LDFSFALLLHPIRGMAATGNRRALSLYKAVLRAHQRYLPHEMRQLGDAYVKSEFRLHRTAKPEQAVDFFREWSTYLEHVEQTGRKNQATDAGLLDSADSIANQFGRDVDDDTRASFSEEQLAQLQKLREEAEKAGKS